MLLLLSGSALVVGGPSVPALPDYDDGGVSGAPPPRRYYVDVDGELIPARSEAEATQILMQIAQEEANRLEAQAEALRRNTATSVGKVDMAPPQVTTDAPVPTFEAQALIDEAYQKAAEAAELALQEQERRKRQKQLDDEAVIRLLM